MSTVLYLDAFAGIAGDMTVAALLHAGAPLDAVLAELASLGLEGWSARVEPVTRGPYAATRFVVDLADPSPAPLAVGSAHEHGHDHGHTHDHGHEHGHTHGGADPGPGTWAAIRALLVGSGLHPRVRERALATFHHLAVAESRVHGMPVDAVSFHEVGAVDSIVDIVGACAAMELLDVDEVVASPLPMGSGRVMTAHGLLPVPVPATVEVLRGWPVEPSGLSGELVTPTGAALVAALARPGPMPAMIIRAVGYGAGTRDPSTHANVLRAVLGSGSAGSVAEVLELRAQVDDLPGELVPPLLDALFAAGALDAWVSPVLMKKGRPGLLIGALCAPDRRQPVGDALFRHAGTFGYRWERLAREVAARRHVSVTTAWGPVRVKLAEREGRVVHAAVEFEDAAALARAAGVPVAAVMADALAAWGRS